MFAKTAGLLGALALTTGVHSHYAMSHFNGVQSCLRPLRPYDNGPVDFAGIDSDNIICGANPTQSLPFAQPPCPVAAGGAMTFSWDQYVEHPGPSHVYISRQTENPRQWAKVWQDQEHTGNTGWHEERMTRVRQPKQWSNYTVQLPSDIADGRWVIRVDHQALHAAGNVGGAQFYIRCIDIEVTGGKGKFPSPVATFPGAFNQRTPGVMWDLYAPQKNPGPKMVDYGPPTASWVAEFAVASWTPPANGTVTTTSTTTVRTTTTITTTRAPVTTTTTSVRPTTTTTTTIAPVTTQPPQQNCAPKYGQCGKF
ncbi:hypothetical protein HK097_002526 [Rhizophlyctis rosea]|uniref:lytic cellulose monooxygenase (C4-dehydrogenating) n=1 Tax=Rhizophlyctis rosea TaxID=64517 RepID=A0AAD5SFG2_9FUNG|nr:hypothetical protein HK097_002526 [Rhizophlyctis rosea]